MTEKFKSIEHVLEYIRDHGPILAKAKAERIYLQEYRKSLKATLCIQSAAKTIADRENEAYAAREYLEHIQAIKYAIEHEEKERWGMVAAQVFIDVFRSREATNRLQDRSHT